MATGSYRENKNKQTRKDNIKLGSIIFVFILFGFGVYTWNKNIKTKDEFLCGETIPAKTVIVLDHSQPVPIQTMDEIAARTEKYLLEEAVEGEKIAIFSVDDQSKNNLKPVTSLCKPAMESSAWNSNVKKEKKIFKEKFMQPMQSALSVPVKGSKESPIAQALVDLSSSQYMDSAKTTLIIYSDMMEHAETGFSLYRCQNPETTIAQFKASRIGALERPQFKNVNVKVSLIPRHDLGAVQLKCRDKFWPWFFGDSTNNSGVAFSYLPGH
jgi:hypothetical protein